MGKGTLPDIQEETVTEFGPVDTGADSSVIELEEVKEFTSKVSVVTLNGKTRLC